MHHAHNNYNGSNQHGCHHTTNSLCALRCAAHHPCPGYPSLAVIGNVETTDESAAHFSPRRKARS
ncbi:hypothetical protein LY76DRAFT_594970 [Colletotrichum caudatum]|nr:hypothetical protein LY76DRAFT_594970 [Colletotrichum caudatum]